jgi:hypothetical protein
VSEHDYHIDIQAVADDIVQWQLAAMQLPLTDLRDTAAASRNGLADCLNDFNDAYTETDGYITPATMPLVASVICQAVMTAIFTLGAAQRTCQAASSN